MQKKPRHFQKCRGMDFPDQNAMDDKITSLATRLLQGELAHGDAQVNTFAGTSQRQGHRTLGQHLQIAGLDHARVRFGLSIAAEYFMDIVYIGKFTGAVIDLEFPERQPATLGIDSYGYRLAVGTRDRAAAFGVLIDRRPAGQIEMQFAVQIGGTCGVAARSVHRYGSQRYRSTHYACISFDFHCISSFDWFSECRNAEYGAKNRKQQQNQEDGKNDFCDSRRGTGNTGKPKSARNQRNNGENKYQP
jgi:hypothetical protein